MTGIYAFWLWKSMLSNVRKEKVARPKVRIPLSRQNLSTCIYCLSVWFHKNLETNLSKGFEEVKNSILKLSKLLQQKLEVNFFTEGITRVSDLYTKTAEWIQAKVESGFEAGWLWTNETFVKFAKVALYSFELKTPKKSGDLLTKAINAIRDSELTVHNKRLRFDLIMIPILLILILILYVIF
jgi:hypothetical protein